MVRYGDGVVWCSDCLEFYNENRGEHVCVKDRQVNIPAQNKLWCINCGKELTWETAIGYIPPHKTWICWFYCEECYKEEIDDQGNKRT